MLFTKNKCSEVVELSLIKARKCIAPQVFEAVNIEIFEGSLYEYVNPAKDPDITIEFTDKEKEGLDVAYMFTNPDDTTDKFKGVIFFEEKRRETLERDIEYLVYNMLSRALINNVIDDVGQILNIEISKKSFNLAIEYLTYLIAALLNEDLVKYKALSELETIRNGGSISALDLNIVRCAVTVVIKLDLLIPTEYVISGAQI